MPPENLFDGSDKVRKDALVTNIAPPFETPADVVSWIASPSAMPGLAPGAIIVAGRLFMLDAADTTSAHDGAWVCVSNDGKRYKAADLPAIMAVESRTLPAPPAITPSLYQQAWLVPAAAAGAWAGHDDDIAIATGRGWVFVPPRVGASLYSKTDEQFYHYENGGTWVLGMGSPSDGTVTAANLEWPFGLIVESRTLTTPPGGVQRLAYIIGPSATGAWAGHDGKVAIGPGGGWTFLDPVEGGAVYVKAEAREVRYLSGAWSSGTASPLIRFLRAADASSLPVSGAYAYSATAPTTANTTQDPLSVALQASASNDVIEIEYAAQVDLNAAGAVTASLFIDGAAQAAVWHRKTYADGTETDALWKFFFPAPDTLPHVYTIRLAGNGQVAQRNLIIREYAV